MPPAPTRPSKHEIEAKLEQLRDAPVNTAGSQDVEMLPLHTSLMSVNPGSDGVLHWFCPKAEPVTRELATFLLRLHAYKNDKVQEWRERLVMVWRGCADCIKSMDEAKRTSRTTYFGAFSDLILQKFWIDFENSEVRTIVEALTAANIAPDSGKSLADAPYPLLYHILSKPAALGHPFILSLIATRPFFSQAADWPMEPPPPGYLLLVVHKDEGIQAWAAEHLAKVKPIPRDHFEGSHNILLHILLRHISGTADRDAFAGLKGDSVVAREVDSVYPFSQDQKDLWTGFASVLNLLPTEIYESLGVHRMIMSHLHDNGPHFREVLRCMLQATKRLGGKLWSGENVDYPQIVFDSIKDNPAYTTMLLEMDTQKEQPWFLLFFLEYLRSIWDMQIFGDVLARFAAFTCDELQHDRFEKKRPIVMSIALQIMSAALTRANKLKSQSHRSDILDVLDIHYDLIVAVSFSKDYSDPQWSVTRSQALSLIKNMLATDIGQLVKAMLELSALKDTVSNEDVKKIAPPVRRQIWWKVYVDVTGRDTEGIAVLFGLAARTAKLEKLSKRIVSRAIWRYYDAKKEKPPQDLLGAVDAAVDSVNASLIVTRDGFLEAVTKFANFNTTASLASAIRHNDIAKHLIFLMLSPVESFHVAAQTIISQAYDVDVRADSFRAIFKAFPESSFDGLRSYISEFNSYASEVTEACNVSKVLVRCMTDVLDVLGGSTYGLLKDASYVKRNMTETFSLNNELPKLWEAMATSISVIFRRTPKWAVYFDNKMMTEWMRDALIFARDLLEHRRTFEVASLGVLDVDIMHSPSQTSPIGKKMVEDLQGVLLELQAWLRLTDTELLYQSLAFLKSLLQCFRTVGIKPSTAALTKLSSFIAQNRSSDDTKRVSFLNKADVAELEVAVANFTEPEEDELDDLSVSWKRKDKRKSTDRVSSSEIEEIEKPIPHKRPKIGKQLVLDFSKTLPKRTKQTKLSFSDKSAIRKPAQKPLQKADKPTTKSATQRGPRFEGSYGPRSDASTSSLPASSSSSSSSTSESDESDDNAVTYLRRPAKRPSPKRPVYRDRPTERRKAQLIEDPMAKQARLEAQERQRRYEEARRAAMRLKPDITSLHLTILSWQYGHDGPQPPMQLPTLSPVPDSFTSHDHYLSIFRPLLMLEAWAQIVKSKEETSPEVFRVKIEARSLSHPWLDLETSLAAGPSSDWRLNPETDIVLLRHVTEKRCVMAKVTNLWRGNGGYTISLRCCTRALDADPGLSIGSTWQLNLVFSLTTLHREYAALMALPYYDMADIILRPSLSDPVTTSSHEIQQAMEAYRVNEPQAKAIISAMSTKGFSLIQGPPGTGKTWTICGLVGAFLSSRRSAPTRIQVPGTVTLANQTGPIQKLLICAPSNAAIDEITKRLIQGVCGSDGQRLTPKVVRVGAESQINASVRDVSLDTLVEKRMNGDGSNTSGNLAGEAKSIQEEIDAIKEKKQKTMDEIRSTVNNASRVQALENEINVLNTKRSALSQQLDQLRDRMKSQNRTNDALRRKCRVNILAEADVICSTLSGAGHEQLEPFDFSMVIIDEASQSIELSSLIPLKYQCIRCVMVGDPQQLPPTVLSPEASKWGYNQSLFVRLQKHRPEAVHLLSIQYRMHPDISLLPSRVFYDGRLKDGPDMDKKTVQPWHSDPRFGPYRFYSVELGREEADRIGHSLLNRNEARMILACYDGLRRRFSFVDFDYRVGIVSMYRAQIQELRELFKRRYGRNILTKVDFNTVDGFQGQEKDIIILSCVRAGTSLSTVGFLSDIRRMNVAITRSKSSLFIFGHAPTLQRNNKVWSDIIEDARSRSCFSELRDGSYFISSASSLPQVADPSKTNETRYGEKNKIKEERRSRTSDGPMGPKEPRQDGPVIQLFSPKKGPTPRKLAQGVKIVGAAAADDSLLIQSNGQGTSRGSRHDAEQGGGPQPNDRVTKESGTESRPTPAPRQSTSQAATRPPPIGGQGHAQKRVTAEKELAAFMKRKKNANNPFIKR